MIERFDIAGYCRISVDEELNRDNTSIENQKAIIADFVKQRFPNSTLTFYEDRDRSGYTFDQRPGYQDMRRELVSHKKDILIIKDFSRFSRRNGRGLVELEDLRDAGVRIISIGENVDFPNDDDWVKIQIYFMLNEMPVTDTSKKVKSVIKRRQQDGKWICAAPYGYIINKRQEFEIVPIEAEIVRRIFQLYIEGWGYKKIANQLTDEGVPTPRMAERDRKEAAGEEYRRTVKPAWAIVTVQGIIDNDFYIGTLRQGKYTRKKINGKEVKQDELDHIVIERHHQEIIDYRTFATAKTLRESRSTSHYRGQKKYDNVYSGFLECGDCGSPMFAMSRRDIKDAYRCGEYHKRGLKGCTSHHIRVDKLDELLKLYVRKIKDNSTAMLDRLNADLAKEAEDVAETEQSAANLEAVLADLQEELKATKRQRIRDIMKHPEREEVLEETYDELENDLLRRIEGLQNQIAMTVDKRNTIIQVNRTAKTALEVFDDILTKPKLDRNDLQLIIQKIKVYEDRIEIMLKSDIDALLRSDEWENNGPAIAAFAPADIPLEVPQNPYEIQITQETDNHRDKTYTVKVISNGEQLDTFMDVIQRDAIWCDFFYTELTTGLRRGEICGLMWSDFDERSGTLKVNRTIHREKGGRLVAGDTKTYAGTRKIILPPSTAELLTRRKKKSFSPWIFHDPLRPEAPVSPDSAYRQLKKFLTEGGLPNIRFHDLRHTFSTHVLASGVDAKTLAGILGHTKASFTLDTYTHTTGDMQKRAADIVGSFLTDYLGEEMKPWQDAENAATAESA